jgi:hypothetical protein
MEETRDVCANLIAKPVKIKLSRPRRRWDYNIKTYLEGTGCPQKTRHFDEMSDCQLLIMY